MAKGTCRHPDGCDRPASKLGWCSMHYNRQLMKGDVGPAEPLTRWGVYTPDQLCGVEGCERKVRARDLCSFHYSRLRNTGEVGSVDSKYRSLPNGAKGWTAGERHRYYKYGLTPTMFAEILDAQGHHCACCGTDSPKGKGWSVDHCHVSGRVRWILCNNCNTALGQIEENPATALRLYEMCREIAESEARKHGTDVDETL